MNRLEDLYSLLYVYPRYSAGRVDNRYFPQEVPRLCPLVELLFLPIVRLRNCESPSDPNDGKTSFITLPFIAQDPKAIEIVQVRNSVRSEFSLSTVSPSQVILESILLRRQKNMKDHNGKPIVELPPKIVGACAWYRSVVRC